MSNAAHISDASDLEMIQAMTKCAYELGMAAREFARRAEQDSKAFLAASAEFRHCFFAMRMGLRLKLMRRPVVAVAPAAEREARETEPAERDDSRERIEAERERDRDYEPVSLPQFLNSLRGVAASAERRDDLPAHIRETTLPTLKGLLAQAGAPADPGENQAGESTGLAVLARPPAPSASRSRLLSSTGDVHTPRLRRRDSS